MLKVLILRLLLLIALWPHMQLEHPADSRFRNQNVARPLFIPSRPYMQLEQPAALCFGVNLVHNLS